MAESMRTTNRQFSEHPARHFAAVPGDESPRTPIPPRASAYPMAAANVRARFPRSSFAEDEVDIEHIPTRPQAARQLAEIETLIFMPSSLALPVSLLPETPIEEIDTRPPRLPASWEAGPDLSLLDTTPPRSLDLEDEEISPALSWLLLDRVRWWLLHPGRLEMLLWVIGTLVLIGITAFFLFILVLSLGSYVTII